MIYSEVVLIANSLAIAGRHRPLLDPTSLTVARGQLLLVQAEPQPTRTALALALSARMRPSAGSVSWSGNPALRSVRRISALVDSPEINEPEAHLKVRDVVAEDLALQPGPHWRRRGIDAWIKRHQLSDLADAWVDAIDPLDRLSLLTHLALEDHRVELAVFDSPDRHGIPEEDWLHYLQTVSGGRRAPAVVAVVGRIPSQWEGACAHAGSVQQHAMFALPPFSETTAAAPAENAPAGSTEDSGTDPAPHPAGTPGLSATSKENR